MALTLYERSGQRSPPRSSRMKTKLLVLSSLKISVGAGRSRTFIDDTRRSR